MHLRAGVPNQIGLQPICTTPNKGQIHQNTQSEVDANFKQSLLHNNNKSTKTHLWAGVPNQIGLQPISTTPNKGQIHQNTQSEVDANFKSHFYTTTTNQLKLIFGQGCQTKLASNPSVLPQTRV